MMSAIEFNEIPYRGAIRRLWELMKDRPDIPNIWVAIQNNLIINGHTTPVSIEQIRAVVAAYEGWDE